MDRLRKQKVVERLQNLVVYLELKLANCIASIVEETKHMEAQFNLKN